MSGASEGNGELGDGANGGSSEAGDVRRQAAFAGGSRAAQRCACEAERAPGARTRGMRRGQKRGIWALFVQARCGWCASFEAVSHTIGTVSFDLRLVHSLSIGAPSFDLSGGQDRLNVSR